MDFEFSVLKNSTHSQARLGRLKTAHAEVETPIFMPVGTHGGVRSQIFPDISDLGFQILLANTYHLLVRPGLEFFSNDRSLRSFSGWNGGYLTDSGGFQIFSLAKNRTINDQGAVFQNHVDGSKLFLSPELSIQAQVALGSDIMMVLDECIAATASKEEALIAMDRSVHWAIRCLKEKEKSQTSQALFAIVQGALYQDLRKISAQKLTQYPFDGFAIGGLAVGEGKQEREETTQYVTSLLPLHKPRYLMGVGKPIDLLEAVHRGVDMFDCILPTALGQQGVAFTSQGKLDLRRGEFKTHSDPVDRQCSCFTCQTYSKAFLHHLCKSYDSTAEGLIALHNLTYYGRLLSDIRLHLKNGTFFEFYSTTRRSLIDAALEESTSEPKFQIVKRKSGDGTIQSSIKHLHSGEHMHCSEDPWKESQRLYIQQAKIEERLQNGPLVIWDVGLGGATNAMGAVRTAEAMVASGKDVSLHMISFEHDLEPLSLALEDTASFPFLLHEGPKQLLQTKRYSAPGILWELYEGDFVDTVTKAPLPDVIFFDPFSYKVDAPLWDYIFFESLHNRLKDQTVISFTFSASTAVRASLLQAGFYVATGWSTGKKKETTVFMTEQSAKREEYPLLNESWICRWKRSHAKYPGSLPDTEKLTWDEKIASHPQFLKDN